MLSGRSPRVVADTKWKRRDRRKADLGVSGEDVGQVLACAHRYATESAVLIYPHHPAVGRPGLQHDLLEDGQQPGTSAAEAGSEFGGNVQAASWSLD